MTPVLILIIFHPTDDDYPPPETKFMITEVSKKIMVTEAGKQMVTE